MKIRGKLPSQTPSPALDAGSVGLGRLCEVLRVDWEAELGGESEEKEGNMCAVVLVTLSASERQRGRRKRGGKDASLETEQW